MNSANPFCDTFVSPLGHIYLIMLGDRLVGLEFEKPIMRAGYAPEQLHAELQAYFHGTLREFTQPLSFLCGTSFERGVWMALREIPFGQTRTYKWLAERVDRPRGARAVGQALKKNPIPILLPCHRIIESSGDLGGYAPGQDIKRRLLQMEYYQCPQGGYPT